MLTPANQLPPSTRAWIYQANRALTGTEVNSIKKALNEFCHQWQAHGHPLQSNFEVRENRFVVLLVNEEANVATGCSIDGSVRVMKGLQQQLGINFFDRTQIPFLVDGQIVTYPLTELKNAFTKGILKSQTLTVNLLAPTKRELEENWQIPIEKSWLAKYLPKPALT